MQPDDSTKKRKHPDSWYTPEAAEARREYKRRWYAAHPNCNKKWQADNKERIQALSKIRYAANKAKIAEANAKRYQRDKERISEVTKRWRTANRKKYNAAAGRWRVANPGKVRAAQKRYDAENREERTANNKRWRSENKEARKAYKKRWEAANQEKHKAAHRTRNERYASNHREQVAASRRETAKRYAAAHPDRVYITHKAGHARRKARIADVGSFTLHEWNTLLDTTGHKCVCCGIAESESIYRFPRRGFPLKGKLTVDHILPLAMGGTNLISNCQPTCLPCNMKKHNRHINYLTGQPPLN